MNPPMASELLLSFLVLAILLVWNSVQNDRLTYRLVGLLLVCLTTFLALRLPQF
ncbi:MAG: hypothetical protein A4E45_00481 [Methanosaeta sp. PtaB.Bin039]|nr:MAG: hypothetical protein A4E45_00481 [Methanosaeta sp. PtaB.Bin039]OPY46147.1 MAG: hypothetical protein A4E47_00707 [Methanosaeta sp. PtaU1.Bin028]HOT07202.1 hypothetical protein [Methanotrichaceae archaeon]HQF17193.1 hypothetical protein [Methanotrichaceae archaeon]HQI91766.1 hypothetical protein [Methanotrichaceae archaeon]